MDPLPVTKFPGKRLGKRPQNGDIANGNGPTSAKMPKMAKTSE